MEKKFLEPENGKQQLDIILDDDEFQSYYKKAYNKIRNQIQLPGFRRGKVPYNLAKKHYGQALEADAMEIASQEEFQKIVEEDKINLISQPAVTDIIRENGAVKFRVEYEIYPSFTLNDYKGITIDEPVHAVTDEEVEEEIKRILSARGDISEAKIVEDESHVVSFSMIEIDQDTKEAKEGAEAKDEHIFLDNDELDRNLIDALLNTKVGDKVEYEFEHEGGHDDSDDEELEGHHSHLYQIDIKQIQKVTPKELNEEFIKEFTSGKFESEEDFKDEIQFQLQEQWDKKSKELLEQQIVTKLVSENDVPTPPAFVENSLNQMLQNFKQQFANNPQFQNADEGAIREEFTPVAERNVKWELIRNKIVEQEGIEVEDYDIEQLANQEAEKTGQTPEQLIQIIKNNDAIKTSILAKKVMDFILDFAITNEVSFEDIE